VLGNPGEAFLRAFEPRADLKSCLEIVERLVKLSKRFIGLAPPAQGCRVFVVDGQRLGEIINRFLIFAQSQIEVATIEITIGELGVLVDRD
jgi:hypothetical protein